jgi:tetratricopeptide (TPR) repeat protein
MLAVGLNLGVAYYCAGRFDNAIEQFLKMLEVQPDHAALYVLNRPPKRGVHIR